MRTRSVTLRYYVGNCRYVEWCGGAMQRGLTLPTLQFTTSHLLLSLTRFASPILISNDHHITEHKEVFLSHNKYSSHK
ncbi:unnamed protein product [Sphenostylis stenocarpa]|uniref:Uncharacterized protein n=1 Tax=Sphenostylis stenocarpa TaxID=92480 RepID=A0AA86VGC4_9FABA|nr:unnamed protein product [Sphenostylis stenocarpa]